MTGLRDIVGAIQRQGDLWIIQSTPIPGIGTGAAYASGDAFGTAFSIPMPIQSIIESTAFKDLDNEGINKELWMFSRPIDGTADNAAFQPTDAELADCECIIPFNGWYTANGNQMASMSGLALAAYFPEGRAWCQFVTRGADNIAAGSIPLFSLRAL